MTQIEKYPWDLLPTYSRQEASLRSTWASNGGLALGTKIFEMIDASGIETTIGKPQQLKGAIIDRMVRGTGIWIECQSERLSMTLLVHADETAWTWIGALTSELLSLHATIRQVDGHYASARLRHEQNLTLLPVEFSWAEEHSSMRLWLLSCESPDQQNLASALAERIYVTISVVQSITQLSISELNKIEAGDAISIDWVAEPNHAIGRLPGKGKDLDFIFKNQELVFKRWRPRLHINTLNYNEETTMSDKLDTPLDHINEVEVEITVEIARARMSLAELAKLAEGSVLLTHAEPNERVILRAGDRAIGRGELIKVDGQLAVRIDELAKSNSKNT